MECTHEEAYIEKACCSPTDVGDHGYVECGCGGQDSVVCPTQDCQGISDNEAEKLWEILA